MSKRSFFTTFEISQLCEVNPTTVQNWVKEKKLKAYTTPGGHRRIRREDLVEFMREFGLPIPRELQVARRLVLIVDDENEMLDMLTSVMLSGGDKLEVATARGGVEALLLIGARQPDLLVLDVMMPGMNGFEVCRKLKASATTAHIKIVAITGDHSPSLRQRILQAGADLFFTKPLDVVQFRDQSLKLIDS
jgi:excisionase family DNA binding protein